MFIVGAFVINAVLLRWYYKNVQTVTNNCPIRLAKRFQKNGRSFGTIFFFKLFICFLHFVSKITQKTWSWSKILIFLARFAHSISFNVLSKRQLNLPFSLFKKKKKNQQMERKSGRSGSLNRVFFPLGVKVSFTILFPFGRAYRNFYVSNYLCLNSKPDPKTLMNVVKAYWWQFQ